MKLPSDHEIFAFFKDVDTTAPADVRITCNPSIAVQEASVLR